MTTKPIAVWICVSPDGDRLYWTIDSSAFWSRRKMFDVEGNKLEYDWKRMRKLGYQCKRFILSEAEGEV